MQRLAETEEIVAMDTEGALRSRDPQVKALSLKVAMAGIRCVERDEMAMAAFHESVLTQIYFESGRVKWFSMESFSDSSFRVWADFAAGYCSPT